MNEYDIEELNELEDWEDIDDLIDDYFEEMELPKEDKEKRKDFSRKFVDKVLFVFSLLVVMRENKRINREKLVNTLSEEYKAILSQYMTLDDYLNEHIDDLSNEVIDTSLKNDGEFYTSEDRAFLISVNEANTGFNYQDYIKAIESGKTRKRWITEKDKRVRRTHRDLDDKTIPIMKVFRVGKTYMRFPHDTLFASNTLEELSNCRCSIKYL